MFSMLTRGTKSQHGALDLMSEGVPLCHIGGYHFDFFDPFMLIPLGYSLVWGGEYNLIFLSFKELLDLC